MRANAASIAEAETRVAADFVDFVLRDALSSMRWGLQAACDQAWLNRGRHFPQPHRQAAHDALVAIGWLGEAAE